MKSASCEANFISTKGGKTLKTKVKEYRKQKKLTQEQLADLVEVTSRTIISIEKEQYNPSLLLAYRLALALDSSVEDLCCLEENKEIEDQKRKGAGK